MGIRILLAAGPTFAFIAVLLTRSLVRLARFGVSGSRGTWEHLARLLSNRVIMAPFLSFRPVQIYFLLR